MQMIEIINKHAWKYLNKARPKTIEVGQALITQVVH